MKIFQVSYKTIYNWFARWESEGMVGLYNQPGRGRKPTFNAEQKAKIKEWAAQEPRQLKKVVQKVKSEWGIAHQYSDNQKNINNALYELAPDASSGRRGTKS